MLHINLHMTANTSAKVWLEEARGKIRELEGRQIQQSSFLDLRTETSAPNTAFSLQLNDLLRREELLLGGGMASSSQHNVNQLAQRIDKMLHDETKQFFSDHANRAAKSWTTLLEKQLKELQNLRELLTVSAPEVLEDGSNGSQSFKHALGNPLTEQEDPHDLAVQRLPGSLTTEEFHQLERKYNSRQQKDWGEYERYNLSEAFAIQKQRLETEWSAYELQTQRAFEMQMAQLSATTHSNSGAALSRRRNFPRASTSTSNRAAPRAGSSTNTTSGASPQWQSRERQSRFAMTVPVLAPGEGMDNFNIGNSPESLEVSELRRRYNLSKSHLEIQKAAAHRWVKRQQLRLEAQVEGMEHERIQRAEKTREADVYINILKKQLSRAERSLVLEKVPGVSDTVAST